MGEQFGRFLKMKEKFTVQGSDISAHSHGDLHLNSHCGIVLNSQQVETATITALTTTTNELADINVTDTQGT